MSVLTFANILLLIYCITFLVEADVERTYKFGRNLSAEKTSNRLVRKKRADLFGNDTAVVIADIDGATTIYAPVCVRPKDDEQNVSFVTAGVDLIGLPPYSLVFYLNESQIGNLTDADCVRNNTVTSETLFLCEAGQIGDPVTLTEGDYVLKIVVTTNVLGIELDSIKINATRQDSDEDIFRGSGFNISVSGISSED